MTLDAAIDDIQTNTTALVFSPDINGGCCSIGFPQFYTEAKCSIYLSDGTNVYFTTGTRNSLKIIIEKVLGPIPKEGWWIKW